MAEAQNCPRCGYLARLMYTDLRQVEHWFCPGCKCHFNKPKPEEKRVFPAIAVTMFEE